MILSFKWFVKCEQKKAAGTSCGLGNIIAFPVSCPCLDYSVQATTRNCD